MPSVPNPSSPYSIVIGGDLTVSRLGFGAMRVTGAGIWGPPKDRRGAIALLRHVVASGVTFIDTADSYGPNVSEELIAEALHPYPEGLVIATKGGLSRPGPGRWVTDCRPAHLRQACEGSLRRLKREQIDLYQLHDVDGRVPVEESIGVLLDLQREGKVRHIGVSNVTADELARARRTATVVSVQNRYNLADRGSDPVLEVCARDGLAFIPWYPLAAGRLTQPGAALDRIAKKHGATTAQIALAWLLQRAPVMLPIPGTSSIPHFDENLAAARIRLDEEEMSALLASA